ncbi:hypothetical protein [Catellatospora sichuanensis]|uniref:hypothetical protein n=1 Tax=Catellatospora sichuanensis TaxID=1969805 RepID=UPI0011835E67|nr:hypothetical protein [Catellatospora sichuanensis]
MTSVDESTPTAVTRPENRFGQVCSGFAAGAFGFLLGVWAFVHLGLFVGQADYADQMATGLAALVLCAAVAVAAVPILAWRDRRRRPARSLGLLLGWLAGLLIVANVLIVLLPIAETLPSGCTCDPLIERLRISGPF